MSGKLGGPAEPHGRAQRHRLIPREKLAAAYEEEFGSSAISEYALTVRDVVENSPLVGPVDTWAKFVELIRRDRPDRDQEQYRKKLSRHFTKETKGPPWQTVVLVLDHLVPPDQREATKAHFARLYQAARGEGAPTSAGPSDADGPSDAGGEGPGGEDSKAGRSGDRDRRRGNQRRTAGSRGQVAILRRRLAASETEGRRLRSKVDRLANEVGRLRVEVSRLRAGLEPVMAPPATGRTPTQHDPSGGLVRGICNEGRFPTGRNSPTGPAAGEANPVERSRGNAPRHEGTPQPGLSRD